ncbi:hypothetical protein EDD86DRAFT_244195 [Gorgonomyces haynaldii]|nr:hypothetical protein EDD86DRAFT_244195 [Gorgonomyces haynaldii]
MLDAFYSLYEQLFGLVQLIMFLFGMNLFRGLEDNTLQYTSFGVVDPLFWKQPWTLPSLLLLFELWFTFLCAVTTLVWAVCLLLSKKYHIPRLQRLRGRDFAWFWFPMQMRIFAYSEKCDTSQWFSALVDGEEDECPICLEQMDKLSVRANVCGHAFHSKCIDTWIQDYPSNSKCPLCKQSLIVLV